VNSGDQVDRAYQDGEAALDDQFKDIVLNCLQDIC